jgi:hypothetical protein
MLRKNVGRFDRIIRLLLVAPVILFGITGIVRGTPLVVLGVAVGVLFVTGVIGFCPFYRLFGWSTHHH